MENDKIGERSGDGQHTFLRVDHLQKICLDDRDKVEDLLTHAIPILENNITTLSGYLERSEDALFLKELHRLKGSLGVVEPFLLFTEAQSLEEDFMSLGPEDKAVRVEFFLSRLQILRGEMLRELH